MMKAKLGIYIHIPFCWKKCNYCDFISFSKMELADQYLIALINEIKASKYKDYIIDTIYFGGGTPSAIPSEYVRKIFIALQESFDLSNLNEVSIEVNPGTVTKEKLEEYFDIGINRVSVGVQSFDSNMLKRLGRIHTKENVYDTIDLIRKAGFENYSLDLMYGLPEDSLERIVSDLSEAIALKPKHISIYGLIIEEGTKFEKDYAEGKLILPTDEDLLLMRHLINQSLLIAGYKRYEISNYCQPGFESRHNLIYWHNEDYLGFGLGSTSKIDNCRYRNTQVLEDYIDIGNDLAKYDLVEIDDNMAMEDGIILGLRLSKGLDLIDFVTRYNIDIREKYREAISELEQLKLISLEDDHLRLTENGFDVANYCMVKFLS